MNEKPLPELNSEGSLEWLLDYLMEKGFGTYKPIIHNCGDSGRHVYCNGKRHLILAAKENKFIWPVFCNCEKP